MEAGAFVIAGLAVGVVVGLTGVGGGALMTPLLILLGVPPATAVGTDLAYAALTKAGAAWAHHRRGQVAWPLAARLLAGAVPAVAAGLGLLAAVRAAGGDPGVLIRPTLAAALVLTGVVLLLREWGRIEVPALRAALARRAAALTVAAGAVVGLLVALSSVGAGALGTAALVVLHPALAPAVVVGTGIAYAVPLAALAAAGHVGLGTVDGGLLALLAAGSLPGAVLGARLGGSLPAGVLRPLLAVCLVAVGVGLVW
ncbi:sulfite exporter TauE/SafE family protein [Inmirania thermothiophila]|uniref:Probable membrane transporter protein n=1 Tax=Inmirania thermothiophila TaxID=1750597 RepID=A0A3N1Y775_9GAMM|nr:sulfite exporter TauE/SafE family protein [Inmirania thermothiophila]ROR34378.1 hypothetical protein EDC57_0274 [Inmirania thermothiophila]